MKKYALLLILILMGFDGFAQKKLIKSLINTFLSNEVDTVKKSSLMPIPVLSFAQETGLVAGGGVLYSFYTDKNFPDIRNSSVYVSGTVSTKKQYAFAYIGDFWTKGNQTHIVNSFLYRKFSNNFYGIGNQTAQADADNLLQYQLKASLEVERLIAKNVYLGPTLAFEKYDFSSLTQTATWQNPNLIGKQGGKVLFLGLASSYDSRNDNNYPTQGMYHRITLQYAPNFFKKDNFTGFQTRISTRTYHRINDQIVLASNAVYNGIFGNKVPFYLMQNMGNDLIMRAYYSGRFRDKNLLAMQAELRYRFVKRFSVVAFGGTGQVFDRQFSMAQFKPNYGAGVRYFFDINKNLSVRMDYGFGEKRPGETRQKGFYFSMSEAF